MASLKYLGDDSQLINYKCNTTLEEWAEWLSALDFVQFDSETNVVPHVIDRELKILQFGDLAGEVLYIIQWSYLDSEQKKFFCEIMHETDAKCKKIIQNAKFDYNVLQTIGVIIENVWCTWLAEKALVAGYITDKGYFSLKEILLRRYGVDISKAMQCEFGDDILTDEKLIYAATDVVHLGKLYLDQRNEAIEKDLLQLFEGPYSENKSVLAFADMEYTGWFLDIDKWLANIEFARPIVDKAKIDLSVVLHEDKYRLQLEKQDVNVVIRVNDKERKYTTKAILPEDTFLINWNSGPQKLEVLQLLFPDLTGGAMNTMKKYLQDNDPEAPQFNNGKHLSENSKVFHDSYIRDIAPNKYSFLKLAILGEFSALEEGLLANFLDVLTDNKYYFKAGTLMLNWNSQPAKLKVFQMFDPKIESTEAEVVSDHLHVHPFFKYYQSYQYSITLTTKYGEAFIAKHVASDGRVRSNYDPIKSTGRPSSSNPNMNNIPANALPKERANDYRNCFTPGNPDWVVVSSDYKSQESAVLASMSGEPAWLEALEKEQDLHSICAELVYKDKWKAAQGADCAFYKLGSDGKPERNKCKCPEHGKLRSAVKAVSFGLAYGISAIGLSVDLDCSKEEAQELMDEYFATFTHLSRILDGFGRFGTKNGYIQTPPPMRRKRYFEFWRPDLYGAAMNAIERQSKNMPIQGLSADMSKIAMILMREYINKNNLRDWIKLTGQVYDQIDSICHKDVSEQWASIMDQIMENAATICLGNNLLKSDTDVNLKWTK